MRQGTRLAGENAVDDELRGVDPHLQGSVDQIVNARIFTTASADFALTAEDEAGSGGKGGLFAWRNHET